MSERPENYWEAVNVLSPATMRRRSKAEQIQEIRTVIEIEEKPISEVFPKTPRKLNQE